MPKNKKADELKAHVAHIPLKRKRLKALSQKGAGRLIRIADAKKRGRAELAAACRDVGAEPFFHPVGGAHADVQKRNAEIRTEAYLESNHSPPNDCYKGSKYESIPISQRPAHSMLYYHHRSPRGSLGGASSTGGSGVNKGWSGDLNALMKAGSFHLAMKQDFVDVLNSSAPNRSFYALALYFTALYALNTSFRFGDGTTGSLISGPEFTGIVNDLLGPLMSGSDVAEAMKAASYGPDAP